MFVRAIRLQVKKFTCTELKLNVVKKKKDTHMSLWRFAIKVLQTNHLMFSSGPSDDPLTGKQNPQKQAQIPDSSHRQKGG